MARDGADGRRGGEPRRVGELLRRVVPPAGARLPRSADWREAVGERVAPHATPRALFGGTLTVAVDSAPLLHELAAFHGDGILVRLRAAAPDLEVRRIRFRLSKGL